MVRCRAAYARPMGRAFAVRGIVEGFYGTPWSHAARLDAITFLAPRGLNAYVYAPKDDPKHRADWRVPYDAAERARFGELAAHAEAHGARFGFAISPGLDVTYESAADRAAILAKLQPLLDAGRPVVPAAARRHPDAARARAAPGRARDLAVRAAASARRRLAHAVPDRIRRDAARRRISASSAPGLPPEVDVMWTGPTVCSPTLRADDARGWTDALGGHRTIVWDNTPVNDATMTHELHLGPYLGRDPDLVDVVGGVLCNPMTQPRASLVQLATAMEFLRDPDGYDAPAAWARACADVGGERAEPLAVLARACADGPLIEPGRLELSRLVDELEAALDGPGLGRCGPTLAAELRCARAPARSRSAGAADDELSAELAPWAAAASAHASAGLGGAAPDPAGQPDRGDRPRRDPDRASARSGAGDAPRLRTHLYMDGRPCR